MIKRVREDASYKCISAQGSTGSKGPERVDDQHRTSAGGQLKHQVKSGPVSIRRHVIQAGRGLVLCPVHSDQGPA